MPNSFASTTVKLGKPRTFHANGRANAREPQNMRGKGSGKSKGQQGENPEKGAS